MPSLETTNWILAIIAAASAAQFLMFFIGVILVARRISAVQDKVTKALTQFEATHLPELSHKVGGLVDDLHKVAVRMDRIGEEVERTTRIAQSALNHARRAAGVRRRRRRRAPGGPRGRGREGRDTRAVHAQGQRRLRAL